MKNKEVYQKIVQTYLTDSFPKDKKNRWGKHGLEIVRYTTGFGLQYNGVVLLYRGENGLVIRRRDHLGEFTEMIEGEAQLCSKKLDIAEDAALDSLELFW